MARDDQKKKKSGLLGWGIAILLLLGGGYGIKNGSFGMFNGNDNSKNTATNNNTENQKTDTKAESRIAEVSVKENDIFVDGEKVEPADLVAKITEMNDIESVQLVDDNAIKSTFEQVITYLEKANIKISEVIEK